VVETIDFKGDTLSNIKNSARCRNAWNKYVLPNLEDPAEAALALPGKL